MAEQNKHCPLQAGSDDCFAFEGDLCNSCPWWMEEMVAMVDDWSDDDTWEE